MKRPIVILSLFSAAYSLFGQNAAFQPKMEFARVTVNVFATSYRTIRSSAGEQDAYIAAIVFRRRPGEVVRLLDRFREVELPIAPTVLASRRQLTMIVIRDPTCDQSIEEMLASGSAVEMYDRETLDAFRRNSGASVPCYRTIHTSIRIAK